MAKTLNNIDEWKQKKGKTVPDGGVTQAIADYRALERKIKAASLSSTGDLIDLHNLASTFVHKAELTLGKCKPVLHKESMEMLREIIAYGKNEQATLSTHTKAGQVERARWEAKGRKAVDLLKTFVATPGQQTAAPALDATKKIAVTITRDQKVMHDAKGLLPLRDSSAVASERIQGAIDKSFSPAALADVRKAAAALVKALDQIPVARR